MSQQATSATPFLTFLTIIWGRECVHSCVLRHGSNECDSLLHLHIRNHPLQARAHLIWTVQTVTSDRACVEPCLRERICQGKAQQSALSYCSKADQGESYGTAHHQDTVSILLA